ncbi:MAG: hypothetical protein FJX66_14685 [Alphaproteobacteria bacterium]|nr:hypothetical protein [Alphaproteobacteria bacterium]
MDDLMLARALHVVAGVLWIGGVGFVTLALLPVLGRDRAQESWFTRFAAFERRFAWIARIMVLVAGGSGFYLIVALDAWDRFGSASYWWMHAMVIVWAIFTLFLFVLEPLVFERVQARIAKASPSRAHRLITRLHWVLLALSLIAVFGAVAGSHGGFL